METDDSKRDEYDLFLSYASPDKDWVHSLEEKLKQLGLRVFVDAREIAPGDDFVLRLSDGLRHSRYLALILSTHTQGRHWVFHEVTNYMAGHGPVGRVLPVKIDAVEPPGFLLNATHSIDAIDRDAERVAGELFKVVGDASTLPADDPRRLVFGRDLRFTLSRTEDDDDKQLHVVSPDGSSQTVLLPWKVDNGFALSLFQFQKLHREPLTTESGRADLFRHARVLGAAMFDMLFPSEEAQRLVKLLTPDRPRPVVQICSDDDLLLSLPWELLCHKDEFLVREGRIDLLRTTPTDVAGETLLKEPTTPFKLVVNVSAPEGSHLSYEAESYRISLAAAGRCPMVPTELGTLDDLVDLVDKEQPTGIHFSGHGAPGALQFEDDEGRDHKVEVDQVIQSIRQRLPDNRRLPPFFYLASCHGNDPTAPGEEQAGDSSAAVQLHKAGVTEVVGYFGPIVDELSTRAEETIYEAIAEGRSTRDAVRRARENLKQPFHKHDARHRPNLPRSDVKTVPADGAAPADAPADTLPFAWAQLVLYRRGPEWPLSVAVPAANRQTARVLERKFDTFGDRKILQTGFIGRRREQHKVRRRLRQGDRVLVFQGLGGLGKSTLAQKVLPWLTDDPADVCTLWCQEVEGEDNRAEALVAQLLVYCRERFGLDWEGVVQQVDQAAGDDPAKRFIYFLHTLVQNAPGLVLYLDNLESLLVGPQDDKPDDESDSETFGQWAEPALEVIWGTAQKMARETQSLYLIASCRYRNDAFTTALLPVTPLPADALFRLTEWFDALQRLAAATRAQLVSRLDGHPRAVEYANDLVRDALGRWRSDHGEWSLSAPPKPDELKREWEDLVNPCLPQVDEKLKDNLLLAALWDRVLDEPARRFLYRMTILRQPAELDLLALLGEPEEPPERALDTARRLRDTSLLEQVELLVRVGEDKIGTRAHFTLHPATQRFIQTAHDASPELLNEAHRRLGEHLEAAAKESQILETIVEAGHHLFETAEYDRAYQLLGAASDWLQGRGRVREGLRMLEPFLDESVQSQLDRRLLGRLLGTVGSSHLQFREFQKAIGYYQQRLAIAQEIGDRHGETVALGNLGIVYKNLGDVRKAIAHYEQQLLISREIGDRNGETNVLGNLGNVHARLGDVQKAISYHEQALVISREIGDRKSESDDLGNLGTAYAQLGEVKKAIGYFERALVIAGEIGDRRGEGSDLSNLGSAFGELGEHQKAIGYYDQALIIAREIGDRQGEGHRLGNLGTSYLSLGELEKAKSLFQQAQAIGEQIGDPRIVEKTTRALAKLAEQ